MSQPHDKAPLYLLDVYAFVYRAYFAFIRKPLRNSRGENVSAVYGFFRFLFSLFEQRKPALFAAVLDSRGPTFRHQQFEAYKATRQKTPDDLLAQFPKVEALLEALSVPALRCEGYEADDVIATLARKCEREGRACFIVSGDKDLLQLVGNGTRALRPAEGFGFREIDAEGVFTEWGVTPAQIRDYLSLVGDVSDNVPGVKGIGDKTAQKLLAQFGSLDAIYEHLEEIEPESLRRKLEAGKQDAFVSRELVTLCESVPECMVEPDALVARLDHTRAAPLFLADDMKSLVPEAVTVSRYLSTVSAAGTAAPAAQAAMGTELEQAQPFAPSLSPSLETSRPSEPASVRLEAAGSRSSVPAHYEAVLDAATLTRVIDRCLAAGVCALDTETTSLDPLHADLVGFSLCCEEGIAWYVPLINPEGQSVGIEAARHALARLAGMETDYQAWAGSAAAPSKEVQTTAAAPAATGTELVLVGHNIKFDLHVLARLGIRVRRPLFDTMIAAWVLDAEALSFSLSTLASRHLGLEGLAFDEVVPKGSTFADVALSPATQYACEDADFTYRLYRHFREALESEGLSKVFYEIEMPLIPILAEMEEHGIRVDAGKLRAYGAELEIEMGRIEQEIYKLVGHPFNIASPKQLAEVLFGERKLPIQKRTRTGISTDVSVLEELAPLDPVPELILRYRMLAKLKSTYVEPLAQLAERWGRIHTTYLQTGAATGRLSSRDPNLQNIPIREEEGRRIRDAFIAEPGHVLISADYSQIELAVLAHLSRDPNLLAAFREGVDIHRRTASFIFGIPESEVDASQRRIAKTINFGVIYGMSAFRLARDLGIPNGRAKAFIDAYFATYAGIANFIRKTIEEAETTEHVTTLFGRRRRILAITSRNKTEQQGAQRVAVNTPIQGTAADIVKIAMIRVQKALQHAIPEVKMLLQVHDELIFEAPVQLAESAMALIRHEMEHAVQLDIPLRVSIESAPSWGAMHV